MQTRKVPLLFLLGLFPLLFACVLTQKYPDRCTPPPSDFSEGSLIGTWVASDINASDTLIIKADHTYKQLIRSDNPVIDYESDWQEWKLITVEGGIPYLVFDGLRMCAYLREPNCNRAGSDGGLWWDFCEKKAIEMPKDGGIIIALGIPSSKQQITGFWLTLPSRFTDAGAWTYVLQAE